MTGSASSVPGVDVEGMRGYLQGQPVRFALLFGSRVRGEGDARSDVDVTLHFEADLDRVQRFRHRNRVDAALQAYAEAPVDVSDFETLPTGVALDAIEDGIVLAGEEESVRNAKRELEAARETDDRGTRERREALDRLASGDA